MVPLPPVGTSTIREKRNKFPHRICPAPAPHKELRNRSMGRNTNVAEGIYRISTQFSGICNAGVLLGASPRCTNLKDFLDNLDTASFSPSKVGIGQHPRMIYPHGVVQVPKEIGEQNERTKVQRHGSG